MHSQVTRLIRLLPDTEEHDSDSLSAYRYQDCIASVCNGANQHELSNPQIPVTWLAYVQNLPEDLMFNRDPPSRMSAYTFHEPRSNTDQEVYCVCIDAVAHRLLSESDLGLIALTSTSCTTGTARNVEIRFLLTHLKYSSHDKSSFRLAMLMHAKIKHGPEWF